MFRFITKHIWRTDNNFKLTAMFTKFILAVTLLSFSLVSNGNTSDTTQSKLVGKWLLVKHLITDGVRPPMK